MNSDEPCALQSLLERVRNHDSELATLAELVSETGVRLDDLRVTDLEALSSRGALRASSHDGFRDVVLTDRAWLLLVSLALPRSRRALERYRVRWRRLRRPQIEEQMHDLALLLLYRGLERLGWR